MATCKNCLHNKLCEEINGLKCRSEFIWYDEEGGCPYYIESSADVVEVVRCKDCKYWGGSTFGYVCEAWSGMDLKNHTRPNGFCSYAVRKEKT